MKLRPRNLKRQRPKAQSRAGRVVLQVATITFVLLCLFCSTGSGDFEEGKTAYERGDYSAAFLAWEQGAKKGHMQAQNGLGFLHNNGLGTPVNHEAAFTWFKKAAEKGQSNAKTQVGLCYYEGLGVKQDGEQAVSWFRRGVAAGDPNAEYALGRAYFEGRGVDVDEREAYLHFTRAANNGVVSTAPNRPNHAP